MSRDIRYVKVGNGKHPRIIVDSTVMDARDAAITLAGLEVALAAALREAGMGRCLRCGKVSVRENMPLPPWCAYELHCHKCGGILSPVAEPAKEDQ